MDQQIDHHGKGPRDSNPITDEERKIRDQLEEEVERGLEDEIKDGIRQLAIRLQRLYESQKERMMKSKQGNYATSKVKSINEVNISIKMDGRTKVEIKEVKKEALIDRILVGTPPRLLGSRHNTISGVRRLDWANSLRSPDVVKKREPFRFG